MQYVLGIGLFRKKFKTDPIIRVSINDILLDEFTLDHEDTEEITYAKKDLFDHYLPISTPYKRPMTISKNIKLYKFNDSIFGGNNKCELEIINNDTNYTNGFMTKSTVIFLNTLFLVPLKYCLYDKNSIQKFNNEVLIPNKGMLDNNIETPLLNKNTNTKMSIEGWPLVAFPIWHYTCWIDQDNISQDGDLVNTIPNWHNTKTLSMPAKDSIGGSGILECPIEKKFGIFMFTQPDHDNFVRVKTGLKERTEKHLRQPLEWWNDPRCKNSPFKQEDGKYFIVSDKFIALCTNKLFNKYIYENQ